MIKPRALKKGDTIGLVALCYAPSMEHTAVYAEHLRQKGFQIKFGANYEKTTYGFAASPEERADDFNAMVRDPQVAMIFFEGGEVGNETLPFLNYGALKENPKILLSYSDGTSLLNAATSRSGLVTFYGQSPGVFYDLSKYNESCFDKALMQTEPFSFVPNSRWDVLRPGECEGVLTGGYLLNYAMMQNGRFFRLESDQKYILFLEDHLMFNIPAAVSRYFSHLEQAGLFELVGGLIWGHYDVEEHAEIREILLRIADRYQIPAVRCEDFGHGENHAIIPIGTAARFDAGDKTLTFTESPFLS